MLTRPIPSSGEAIPVIGLGTWQTFDVGADAAARQSLEAVLGGFLAMGGTLVDSSPMYKTSEEVVGSLAEKLQVHDKLFFATKVWTSGKTAGIEQMEDSMQKLRAKSVDLMQVHNLVDVKTHLETLREWKQQGRVRYIGVTHYRADAQNAVAQCIASETVDFVQINYSAAEPEADRHLLPLCMERGVAVIANRPFGGGDLIRRLNSSALPSWAGEMGCESWSQILLKFVISHPAITCVIPATSNLAHLQDNMKAASGRMPDETLRKAIAVAVL